MIPSRIHLRQKTKVPEAQPIASYASRSRRINFRHPAYHDNSYSNILCTLDARDGPHYGLHAGTALLACAIVAGNRTGYFTATRTGASIGVTPDALLTERDYYFHVYLANEGEDGAAPAGAPDVVNYAVCPAFAEWPFPHQGQLKELWPYIDEEEDASDELEEVAVPTPSNATAAVFLRDKCCVLSEEIDDVSRAHLCPSSEWRWFSENGMEHYNLNTYLSGQKAPDDIANSVSMRRDIHQAFDNCTFTIARKDETWVAHFLKATRDKGRQYHNTKVNIHAGVHGAFLLARFAWSIFPLVRNFFNNKDARYVRLRQRQNVDMQNVWTTQLLQPDQLQSFARSSGNISRPASPTKRSRFDTGDTSHDKTETTETKRKRRRLSVSSVSLYRGEDFDSQEGGRKQQQEETEGNEHVAPLRALKLQALEQQRRSHSDLMCCTDSNNFCIECAGGEFRDLPSFSSAASGDEEQRWPGSSGCASRPRDMRSEPTTEHASFNAESNAENLRSALTSISVLTAGSCFSDVFPTSLKSLTSPSLERWLHDMDDVGDTGEVMTNEGWDEKQIRRILEVSN